MIIWSVVCYLCGALMLITPFLLYQDPYICDSLGEGQCNDFVCGLPLDSRSAYIPVKSMNTLAN